MKGRDALRDIISGKPAETAQAPKRSSGAIRAMNLELQHLSNEAAAAKTLRQAFAGSEPVLELATSEIDPSPVSDRIPTDDDPAFDELKAQIAEIGQQVPILVRPHPERHGRYQVAYGRRRLRVASELGKPVKAIVRQLSDRELVIAQAQENGPRADLTFIERALFASNLLENNIDKDTIRTALGVDKPELSRLLTVANAITPMLIGAIGPAPKIGRPRWITLAQKCSDQKAVARAAKATTTEEFKRGNTNSRFNLVLAAIADETPIANKKELKTGNGQRVAWLERTKKRIRVTSDRASFAAFLEQRLPALLEEFATAEADAQPDQKEGGGEST
jgi:ParB family chromosome partitioning protein